MKSLRVKILIAILAVTILSNLTITQIAYNISKRELKIAGETDLKHVTDSVASEIYAANEQEFRMLKTLSVIPVIKNPDIALAEKYETIKSVIMTDNEYIDVTILDTKGKAYAAGSNALIDLSEREYFSEAKKGTNFVTDPFVNKVNGKLSIVYSLPVYDENRVVINVLIAVVNGQKFSNVVQRLVVGNNRNPIVVSRATGNIIGDITLNNVTGQKNIKTFVTESPSFASVVPGISSADTGIVYYKSGRKNMVVAYRPVPNARWSVMSQVPVSDFEGGIRQMLQTMLSAFIITSIIVVLICGFIIGKSIKPLKNVKNAISKIATGNADLTQRIKISTKDEIGAVVAGFNNFTAKLQSIVTDIKNSKNMLATVGEDLHATTTDTASSITQIVSNIENVNNQITTQASSVDQTAGAVGQIASNIASLDRMIEAQSTGVNQASAAVEEMIGNIGSVKRSVDKMVDSFRELENSAKTGSDKQQDVNERIEQIESQSNMLQDANTVIANIASQTNLLAMNAAIEAAHAGDAGRGFSVVSDEIRKLSETSSEQSKTIGEQLNKIKDSIGGVVAASAESSSAFHSVSEKIQETDELVRLIRAAMEEQSEGSKQIGDTLHSMNDSTTEVKNASDEMSAGNKAILEEITHLQKTTAAMKSSMREMQTGTGKISENGTALSEIAARIRESIQQIGMEIDQFSV